MFMPLRHRVGAVRASPKGTPNQYLRVLWRPLAKWAEYSIKGSRGLVAICRPPHPVQGLAPNRRLSKNTACGRTTNCAFQGFVVNCGLTTRLAGVWMRIRVWEGLDDVGWSCPAVGARCRRANRFHASIRFSRVCPGRDQRSSNSTSGAFAYRDIHLADSAEHTCIQDGTRTFASGHFHSSAIADQPSKA